MKRVLRGVPFALLIAVGGALCFPGVYRPIFEAQIGGGLGDPVDGGTNLEANGDITSDGVADFDQYKQDGTVYDLSLIGTGGGTGDIVGPASATDNAVTRFDGTTGKLVQNSVVTIADSSGNMAGVGSLVTSGDIDMGLVATAATRTFDFQNAANQRQAVRFWNGSDVRWSLQKDTDDGFKLTRYTGGAGGTFQDYPIIVNSASGVITLANDLDVTEGGTGVGTFTDGGVLIGNSTGDIQVTGVGTAGQILTSNGAGADPTFQAAPGGIADGDTLTTGLTFPLSGFHLLDTNATHDLILNPGTDLTADRTLTITTGDANRTLDMTGGNATVSGTNTGDQTITLTGDVTGSGTGSFATTIGAGAVDIAMLSATGTPSSTTYLRGDNTWQTVSGSGDVVGPASGTDNAIVRFDTGTGKLLQDSSVLIGDTGNITGVGTLNTHTIPGGTGTLALLSNITGTNSGTNTGDVTLSGTPDYITISGQVVTRGLVDLTTDVTGELPDGNVSNTLTASKVVGSGSTTDAVDLATAEVAGTLSVSNGGTGATTLGDAGVLIGNGTGAVAATGAGTAGQVLTSNGAGVDPTFQAVAVTASSTNTLTNKRITKRDGSTTSSATPTINTDNVDQYRLTAQTADITSFTTNLTGTPVVGDVLDIWITGTAARAITWGASFSSGPATLPTTTVTTKTLFVRFQYDGSIWVCMAAGSKA